MARMKLRCDGKSGPTRERNYDKNRRSRAFAHVVITAMAESSFRPWHLLRWNARKHAKAGLGLRQSGVHSSLLTIGHLFERGAFTDREWEGWLEWRTKESQHYILYCVQRGYRLISCLDRHLLFYREPFYCLPQQLERQLRKRGGQKWFLFLIFFLPWRRSPDPPPSFLP